MLLKRWINSLPNGNLKNNNTIVKRKMETELISTPETETFLPNKGE